MFVCQYNAGALKLAAIGDVVTRVEVRLTVHVQTLIIISD